MRPRPPKIKRAPNRCDQFSQLTSRETNSGYARKDVDAALRASCQTGTARELSNAGARNPAADIYHIARCPEGRATSLLDGRAESDRLQGLGAVKGDKTNAVGMRVLRDSPNAKAIAIALNGSDASLAKHHYRIIGIESMCATLKQVGKVLHAMKWECEVYDAA